MIEIEFLGAAQAALENYPKIYYNKFALKKAAEKGGFSHDMANKQYRDRNNVYNSGCGYRAYNFAD